MKSVILKFQYFETKKSAELEFEISKIGKSKILVRSKKKPSQK